MRRAPSLAALLLAALACGALVLALGLELRRAVPERTPAEAVRAATADRADARRQRFEAQDEHFDVAFDAAMVRDRVVWRSSGQPATTDLAIVNATPDADLAATARACARSAGAPKQRVQCYVFASTEAYDYKHITADLELTEPTAIVNLCWAVLASNAAPGAAVTVSDMRQAAQTWEAQGCPDGWQGSGGEGTS